MYKLVAEEDKNRVFITLGAIETGNDVDYAPSS